MYILLQFWNQTFHQFKKRNFLILTVLVNKKLLYPGSSRSSFKNSVESSSDIAEMMKY